MAGTVAAMLHEAASHIGYREGPNNHTKFGEWYAGKVHDRAYAYAPWCDMFVSYCADRTGSAGAVGRFAYTPSHASWFYSRNRWRSGTGTPQPGDIVFFDWGRSRRISAIDHVGIVERVSGGYVHTIEGNSANVVRRLRYSVADSRIAGYGRPVYAASPPPSKPGKPTTPPKGKDMPTSFWMRNDKPATVDSSAYAVLDVTGKRDGTIFKGAGYFVATVTVQLDRVTPGSEIQGRFFRVNAKGKRGFWAPAERIATPGGSYADFTAMGLTAADDRLMFELNVIDKKRKTVAITARTVSGLKW